MFLDTSAIVELMRGQEDNPKVDEILRLIKDELIFISVVQLGEVNDWCLQNCPDPARRIAQLRDIVITIPLNEDICVQASQFKHDMRSQGVPKFSLMDGMILASARYIGQRLLTLDNDFRKADDVILVNNH